MKLKLDDAGKPMFVTEGGKTLPVFVHGDGKELPFDAESTLATITRLNHEAQGHRTAKEDALGKLAAFAGIDDPAAALAAMKTVKNLDDKKLVDANQVAQIKDEAIKAVRAEYEPHIKERDTLRQQLHDELIGGAFARSPLIVGDKAKVGLPADIVQAKFGSQFKIEDGKVVAYDAHGQKVFSRTRPGELADFNEALEVIIDAYPAKNTILKGANASGGGAGPNYTGGKKSMPRAAFEALDPVSRAAEVKGGTVIT